MENKRINWSMEEIGDEDSSARNEIVRIVVISDTHFLHDQLELPTGDVLIHCGDFTNRDSLESLRSFRDWFQAQTQYTDRIVVDGNHEEDLTSFSSIHLKTEMAPQATDVGTFHFLRDETIIVAGGHLRVHGFSCKSCQEERFDNLDEPIDILVSHMPAYWLGRASFRSTMG